MVFQKLRVLGGLGILLAGVVLFAPTTPATGQGTELKLGASGGMTAMTYGGENASDAWGRRTGNAVGVLALIHSPNDILLGQAEARYVQKGARAEIQQGSVEVTDKLNYFDFTLIGKLPLPISTSITPNLQGGFSTNVGFGGTREFDGPNGTVTEVIDPADSMQWALLFGTGIDVGLYAPVTLALDARYVYGLRTSPYSFAGIEGASFRNQGFMVNVGLAFSVL